MKDVLIIAQYTPLPIDTKVGRFNYIAEKIAENEDYVVEIVTTSFEHIKKQHIPKLDVVETNYKYTMLYEPGYKKNVCLQRIWSHRVLASNLKKYLHNRKRPDVIYCAIPSLAYAKVAAQYAKKNNIRFIIDVQDLWPEAFEMVFHVPIISKIIFAPMKKNADYIYRQADEIVAVSETYVLRAGKVNKKASSHISVYLGTEKNEFDKYVSNAKLSSKSNDIWLVYVGTLGHSYDLTCVFEAMKELQNQNINNIKFLVMGEGPLRSEFEEKVKKLVINVEFTGRLPYSEMVRRMTECDIAVNPIMHGAAQSIINKVGDYAMAGLPVISTQECMEYRDLLDQYNAGINCDNGDINQLANAIRKLCDNPQLRLELGNNNRRLAEERFDRERSYIPILELLEKF